VADERVEESGELFMIRFVNLKLAVVLKENLEDFLN